MVHELGRAFVVRRVIEKLVRCDPSLSVDDVYIEDEDWHFVRDHWDYVQDRAGAMAATPYLAEEFVQESFMRTLAAKPEPIKQIENPRAYLGTTLRSCARDRARRESKRSQVSTDPQMLANTAHDERDPEATALARERSNKVRNALEELPPDTLHAVMMRMAGRTNEQVAKEMGVNPSTITRRFQKGFEEIESTLQDG